MPLPPDFATMWTQALQQGFKPKLATVAKVLLFPTDAYAMGSKVYNIATDAWWVPTLPWTLLAHRRDLPASWPTAYTAAGHGPAEREHLQLHPLRDRLRGAHVGEQPARQAGALGRTVQGQAARGGRRPDRLHLDQRQDNPAPGVAITPPVGIQWQKGTKYPLEAKVVDNTLQPNAKITGDLLPTFS